MYKHYINGRDRNWFLNVPKSFLGVIALHTLNLAFLDANLPDTVYNGHWNEMGYKWKRDKSISIYHLCIRFAKNLKPHCPWAESNIAYTQFQINTACILLLELVLSRRMRNLQFYVFGKRPITEKTNLNVAHSYAQPSGTPFTSRVYSSSQHG